MKRFLLGALLLLSLSLCAQDGYRAGDFDFSDFPKVSFVWHEYNPVRLSEQKFVLTESGMPVELSVSEPVNSTRSLSAPRSTVVLWEDMASHGQWMYQFSQSVLQDFFTQVLSPSSSDAYYLATFNRHDSNEPVLRPLCKDFTTNLSLLQQAVVSYSHSTTTYRERPNESDLFPAIHDALELLQQRPSSDIRSLIVITSGMPLENSATNTAVSVQQLALQYHIPIYVMQFAANHGQSDKMKNLAESTYGMYAGCVSANNTENMQLGKSTLRTFYQQIPERSMGQDYLLSFTSNSQRSGDSQQLQLSVSGYEYQDTLIPPSYDFQTWVQDHLWQTILASVLLLIILFLAIFFPVRAALKRKAAEAAMELMRQQQETYKAEAERKSQQQAAELEAYKKLTAKQQAEQERQRDFEEKLQLMQSKNLFPNLQFELNGQVVRVRIEKPELTIGRDSKSDLCIPDHTVSRQHAVIRFVGNGFQLEDLQSRNGSVVDGRPATSPVMLKDNSLINLGAALVKFFY